MSARFERIAALALIVVVCTVISLNVAARLDSELREVMREFSTAMSTLLDNSASGGRGADVDAALSLIAQRSSEMSMHLERSDTAFLAAALRKQMRLLRLSAGAENSAAFEQVLDRSIGTCVGCHSRTPALAGSRLATQLLPADVEARLAPARRARLQIAVRRFDAAAQTLESAIRTARGEALLALLKDYLDLMLRVRSNPDRARQVLDTISAQADTSGLVAAWRKSLRLWHPTRNDAASLVLAEQALSRAGKRVQSERGRVEYSLAAYEAQRWLDTARGGDKDSAKAYLILGSAENALKANAWLPMPELYLEQAISLDPGSATSSRAFSELKQVLAWRFANEDLPGVVAEHLEALKRLAHP